MHTMKLYDRNKPQMPVQLEADFSTCVIRTPTVGQIEKLNIQVFASKQHFFGQLIKYSEEKLTDQQVALKKEYKNLSPGMLPLPSNAEFGVTSFSEDGEMYRVRIQKRLGTHLEVFFLDYGNVETKPRNEVFAIKREFCYLPQQGILCKIIKTDNSDDDIREAVLDNNVEFYIDQSVEDKYEVRLTTSDYNKEVIENLAAKKPASLKLKPNITVQDQGQWTSTENAEERQQQYSKHSTMYERQSGYGGFKNQEREFQNPARRTAKHFEQRTYQDEFKKPPQRNHDQYQKKGTQRSRDRHGHVSGSGSSGSAVSSCAASLRELDINPGSYKEVEVVYFMNMKEFYVQPTEFSGDLNTMMEQIRRTYSGGGKPNKLNLSQGDACAALYANDNVWYRARVEAVNGQNISVYFVDYGNRDTVRSGGVQKLKTELLALPMLAIRCSVEDISIPQAEFVANVMDKRLLANFLSRDRQGGWVVKLLDPSKTGLTAKENLSSVESFEELEVSPGTTENVLISWAESPSELYLQLGLQLKAFKKNMKHMQDYYERLSRSDLNETNFSKSHPVVSRFSQDQVWYRGEIVDKRSGSVSVMFVDYGNKEECPMSSVKKIDPTFMVLPKQALLCKLDGIHSLQDKWSNNQLEKYFSSEHTRATFKGKAGNKLVVSIQNENGDIAEQLIADGLAKRIEAPKYVPRTLPEVGAQVDIFVCFVKCCSQFWIQILDDDGKLDELQSKLEEVYSQGNMELINVEGEACAAKYQEDQAWYRGIIRKDGSDGNLNVQFVDYGNTEHIPANEVRRLSPDLMDLPTQAVEARAIGWDDSNSEAFKDLTDQKELSARIESVTDRLLCVTLFSNGETLLPPQLKETEDHQPETTEASPQQMETSQPCTRIQVCYSETPSKFWYQNCDTKESFDTMMDELEAFMTAEEQEALDRVEAGELCAAICSIDGGWYRAKITNVSDEVASLVFIDYGNSEEHAKDGLKKLPQQFRNLLPAANECSLNAESVGDAWSDEAILNFKDIVGEGEDVILNAVFASDGSLVQLKDGEDRDVAKLMINSGYAVARVLSMLPNISVPTGPRIKVFTSYFISQSEFYVQMADQSDTLNHITETLETNWESSTVVGSTSLCVGYVGAMKYIDDGAWYRVQIQEVGESEMTVFFVDYGNSASCKKEDVRCLNECLLAIPPLAILCQLEELSNSDEAAKVLMDDETEYELVFREGDGKFLVSFAEVDDSHVECLAPFDSKGLESDLAYVSHINDPHDFYVQLSNDSSVLEELGVALEDHYEHHKHIGAVSDTGLAVVHSTAYNGWYRAHLMGKDDGKVNVFFVDYGNRESVPRSSVKRLVEPFANKAVLAAHCSLAYIKPANGDTWTEEATGKFSEFCLDKPLRISVERKDQNKYFVHMKDEDKDIRELLISAGMAVQEEALAVNEATEPEAPRTPDKVTVIGGAETNEIFTTCPYKVCGVNAGKACGGISHIESPSDFWIQLENQSNNLKGLEKKLEEYYSVERDAQTDLNEASAVFHGECDEARYYRCQVLSREGQSAKVLFVDYGSQETVHVEEILELPSHLAEDHMYAVHCKLPVEPVMEGWTLAACERFEEMSDVGDRLLVVQFREKNETDGKWCVHLLDMGIKIADTMVQEGHCTYNEQHQLVGDILDDKSDSTCDVSLEDVSDVDIVVHSTPVKVLGGYKEADIPLNCRSGGIISHYDSPRSFWVQLSEQSSALADLRNRINEYYTVHEPNILQDFSKPCAAVYADNGDGNLYFRARVLSAEDATVRVFFVDHGNSIEVSKKCVFELPTELLEEPVHAIHCRLPLEPVHTLDWAEDALEAFEDLTGQGLKELIIEFKEKLDEIVFVNVFDEGVDIAAAMVQGEYAEVKACQKEHDLEAKETEKVVSENSNIREVVDKRGVSLEEYSPSENTTNPDLSLEEGEIQDEIEECIKERKEILEDQATDNYDMFTETHHDAKCKDIDNKITNSDLLEQAEVDFNKKRENDHKDLNDSNRKEDQPTIDRYLSTETHEDAECKDIENRITESDVMEEGNVGVEEFVKEEKSEQEVLEDSNRKEDQATHKCYSLTETHNDTKYKDTENKIINSDLLEEGKVGVEEIIKEAESDQEVLKDSNRKEDQATHECYSSTETRTDTNCKITENKITSPDLLEEGNIGIEEFTKEVESDTISDSNSSYRENAEQTTEVLSTDDAKLNDTEGTTRPDDFLKEDEGKAFSIQLETEECIKNSVCQEESIDASKVSTHQRSQKCESTGKIGDVEIEAAENLGVEEVTKEPEEVSKEGETAESENKSNAENLADITSESDMKYDITVVEVAKNVNEEEITPEVEVQQETTIEAKEATSNAESLQFGSSSNNDLVTPKDIVEDDSEGDSGRESPMPRLMDVSLSKTDLIIGDNASDSEEFVNAEDSGKEETSRSPYLYFLEDSFTATVLDCCSPWNFLCQMDGVDKLEQRLKEEYEGSEEQVHEWSLSDACSVASSDEGETVWRRGLITGRPSNGKVKVHLVDHGVSGEVGISTLRDLPSGVLDHPVKAVKCSLSSIVPKNNAEWDMDSCARLQELVDKKEVTLQITQQSPKTINEGDTVCVEASRNGKSITELLVEAGYACFIPVKTEE